MHQGRVRIRGGELCEQNGLRVNVPLASRSVGAALLIGTLAISPGVLAEQELGQAASDPTAPLMNFQLQNSWSPEVHGTNDSQNIVQFRTALPYRLAGHQHIFRLTVPSLTEDPGGSTGLSDSTVFDLTTFDPLKGVAIITSASYPKVAFTRYVSAKTIKEVEPCP